MPQKKGLFPPLRNNPLLMSPGRRRDVREMRALAKHLLTEEDDHSAILSKVESIPEPLFADFALAAFEVTGHAVERFVQFDDLAPQGAVQFGVRRFLVRGFRSPSHRDRAMHLSRSLDTLAMECKGRNLSGLFVSPHLAVTPQHLMEVSKAHFGRNYTMSMMCGPDLSDLLCKRCVRDPLRGFLLVYGEGFSPAVTHPYHAYYPKQNDPWWSPATDKTQVPHPQTVCETLSTEGDGIEVHHS
ncbi:hypothetical protein TK90_2784 (plasmid) [Thioalkalivibrio sp. K90mix]|uniref:hypothetical protein n=1 Tax=Thioalkalivibrio sp. (strain K90mix) TaxID=396595 RepID=UPI000195A692|nr:hypothetical protein [Thioalkalivibrio sp. K90mix]ADC73269.1 hypothetical protein TK90_2784 [Thioalkalivibrio sp. K90mix]